MRARLELRVVYDAPAVDCKRTIRVLPRPSKVISAEQLRVFPPPDSQTERLDRCGNRILVLRHARIEREFALSLDFFANDSNGLSALEPSTLGAWKMPSRAVPFSPELLAIARDFRALPLLERAEQLNRFVFDSMEYTVQTSDQPLKASQIWTQKRGSCADFAHVFLSLARASGLPSRYACGFGPFPGALHAWVEVAVNGFWHAFDPTHGRCAQKLYLPVAVGRDFYDCAPHTGTFRGGSARLGLHCELSPRPHQEREA